MQTRVVLAAAAAAAADCTKVAAALVGIHIAQLILVLIPEVDFEASWS